MVVLFDEVGYKTLMVALVEEHAARPGRPGLAPLGRAGVLNLIVKKEEQG